MSKLFNRLIKARGVTDDFLNPNYNNLSDPFLLPDMDKAIERISEAINGKEKVLIYGDYDVDGVTSSIVMEDALHLAGIKEIEIMLPDRFADGYGMSNKILDKVKQEQITLVITVDCGSANSEIIHELKGMGVDTIVTDHHECPDELPKDAVAVVNPKKKEFEGFRDLAGVGVVFKLAQGLVKKELIPNGQEKWLLDLVIIGTICDGMPLLKENRILGFYGMKVLEKTRRPGLVELIKKSGTKKINSQSIGFQIGPRLNAAGRLETADLSLALLRAKTRAEAASLIGKIELLNNRRKVEQKNVVDEIKGCGVPDNDVIVVSGKWHEGILGIVAGKLTEEYKRPSFVLSEISEGIYKGSARSFGDFKLADALKACKEKIISGGGHAYAAGVKVSGENLEDFKSEINKYYKSLRLNDQERFLKEHEDLAVNDLDDFSLEFLEELGKLEPFGEGNKEPIFRLSNTEVLEVRKMGADGQHLCLMVNGDEKGKMKLISFFAPREWFNFEIGDKIDILVRLIENEWNGIRSVEGQIVDIEEATVDN